MNWVSRPLNVTGGVKNYFELPIFRFELHYDFDISWLFQIITLVWEQETENSRKWNF